MNIRKIAAVISVTAMLTGMTGCFLKPNKLSPAALEKYAKKYGAEMYDNASDFTFEYRSLCGDYYLISDGICVRVKDGDVAKALDYTDELSPYYDEGIEEATVFAVGDSDDEYTVNIVALATEFGSEDDAAAYYDKLVSIYTATPDLSNYFGSLDGYDLNSVFDFGDLFSMSDINDLFGALDQYNVDLSGFEGIFDLFDVGFMGDIFNYNKYEYEEFKKDDIKYTLIRGDDIYVSGSDSKRFDAAGVYIDGKYVFFVCGSSSDKDLVNEYADEICEGIGVEPPSSL